VEIMLIVKLTSKDGTQPELQRVVKDVAAPTRSQPGCLEFTVAQPEGEPSVLYIVQRWSSPEHHARNIEGAHVGAFMAAVGGLLAAPPEMVTAHVVLGST
jgi:quinol monooxygenase YgiN